MNEANMPELPAANENESINNPMSGFKLTRIINGERIEIELTVQELREAYDCKEREYYVADIEMTLEEMGAEGKLFGHTADKINANEELMEAIVSIYAQNRDKYNMEWHAAAVDAIEEGIIDAEQNGTLVPISV